VIPLAWILSRFIIKWQRNAVEMEQVRGSNAQAMLEIRDAVLRLEQRVSNLERAVMTAEEHRKYAL
jgi:hypothetical protein